MTLPPPPGFQDPCYWLAFHQTSSLIPAVLSVIGIRWPLFLKIGCLFVITISVFQLHHNQCVPAASQSVCSSCITNSVFQLHHNQCVPAAWRTGPLHVHITFCVPHTACLCFDIIHSKSRIIILISYIRINIYMTIKMIKRH